MNTKKLLVWDLGGTKCAAALVEYSSEMSLFSCLKTCHIKLTECHSLLALANKVEELLNIKHKEVDAICVGAAGIYDGKILTLANAYPYSMPFAEIAEKMSWAPFEIIHDYAPIICSTFTQQIKCRSLNNISGNISGRRVALGIGTGLGLKDGVLFSEGNFWLGSNEMGHIGLMYPIDAPKEFQEIHKALLLTDHFSAEKILSGKGMMRLHNFLYSDHPVQSPEEISERIKVGKANQLLSVFAFYLGLFVGTVQLSFMPSGGIFITGGISMTYPELFDCPEFFQGIHALPSYLKERSYFPLSVITDRSHPFIGAAYYAVHRICQH